ncbi:CRISPR-associated endonuclease Cas1 [Candidatus Gracilibacteria bacterium]|nr:CRISPR-associated endonuclease Cas1 [Candidatus Gracilibacteria bacterium]
MLTKSQVKHKQILTIIATHEKSEYIKLSNENLVLVEDGVNKSKTPLSKILILIIIGRMTISTALLSKLSTNKIPTVILGINLKLVANILPSTSSQNFSQKYSQYQTYYNQEQRLEIAKQLVDEKIQTSINTLQKTRKTTNNKLLKKYKKQLQSTKCIEEVMGVEGIVSKIYFQNLFSNINWQKRQPRHKADITNTLLDLGYTYLYNYFSALVQLSGLDPFVGFLHTQYYSRHSLANDYMEPFRSIIDYEVLKIHNQKRINSKDFILKNNKYQFSSYDSIKKYSQIFLTIDYRIIEKNL